MHQVINCPTHILPNSKSCIDLLFTNQPNLISESGVHSSLFDRCHHQIIYAKLNLKINFPKPYERLIWDFSRANINAIKRSLHNINWINALNNKSVNEKVNFLSDCLINIFTNFVPNKTIICRDKDAPWMTRKIKDALKEKSKVYKKYVKNGRKIADLNILKEKTQNSTNIITAATYKYLTDLANKLNDPLLGSKTYWCILNKFNAKGNLKKSLPYDTTIRPSSD